MKQFTACSSFLKIILLLYLVCSFLAVSAQTPRLDSLLNALKTVKEDTAKANTLREICDAYKTELNDLDKVGEYAIKLSEFSEKINFKKGIAYGASFKGIWNWRKGNYEQALLHYKKSLDIMQELGNKRGISTCYLNIGQVNAEQGNYPEAIEFMLKGIKLKEELNEKRGVRIGYNNLGNIYATMGDYKAGLNYYFKALKITEELKDRLGESYAYDNIGIIFLHQNKLDIALVYFKKAVKIQEEIGDKVIAGSSYNNIGNIYQLKKKYKDALPYHMRDLNVKEEANDKLGIVAACNSIGFDYFGMNIFDKALSYQLRSYNLSKEIGHKKGIGDAAGGIGKVYEEKKEYLKALDYYDQLLSISTELDFKEGIRDANAYKASVYTKLKQFEKALQCTELYNAIKDTLLNKDNFKQVAELNTRYETDKKEKEILLLTKDQELNAKTIKQQLLLRWGLIGGLILLSIAIASIYRRYRFKQKANVVLEKQKEEIQQKNILITDSIDYAKTIQEAVLPTVQETKNLFPESFILYKPKSIVSGDFYWLNAVNDQLICAVADCTGHGVPGAFMSLLGYNMLEDVVKPAPELSPGPILDSLNQQVLSRLSGDDKEETIKHGMDISLISIDKTNNRLQFAGAHNSLYVVRDSQLIELKADKMGIGTAAKQKNNHFTNQVLELKKGDMIYLFTDGFPDQIGGPSRKKFYYPPFKDLLVSISQMSPETQRNKLNDSHVQWLGEKYDQTDDILIMGIRY
jgi:serine phosphatase RsbU (regulator of sigma subunit)/Tfp pilus assembly protein PilF